MKYLYKERTLFGELYELIRNWSWRRNHADRVELFEHIMQLDDSELVTEFIRMMKGEMPGYKPLSTRNRQVEESFTKMELEVLDIGLSYKVFDVEGASVCMVYDRSDRSDRRLDTLWLKCAHRNEKQGSTYQVIVQCTRLNAAELIADR